MANERGMSYNEVRGRLIDLAKNDRMHPQQKQNLAKSMINQVTLREGQGAAREIVREMTHR